MDNQLFSMLMAQGDFTSTQSKSTILGALWGGLFTKTAGMYFNAQADITSYKGQEQVARINAKRLDSTLQTIKFMGDLSEEDFMRFRNKYTGTIAARTAKNGLEFSGSPIEILVDGLTQIGIDEAITNYDLSMQESDAIYQKERLHLKANIARDSAKLARYSMIADIVNSVASTASMAYAMRSTPSVGTPRQASAGNLNRAETGYSKLF